MSTRQITVEDVPHIIKLLLNLKDESPVYGVVTADIEYVSNNLANMISSGSFLGTIDNGLRGCMFGSHGDLWYSHEHVASEHLLYVLPEYRGTGLAIRLIKEFEELAKLSGSQTLYVGITTGMQEERTRKMYERLGYETHGSRILKRLQCVTH